MTIEFSQFANAGVATEGDIIVGLSGGLNAQFTFPSTVSTTWTLVDTNTAMESQNGYVVNSMGAVTLTVPSIINFGDYFEVVMFGSGSFIVQCNAGQQIRVGTTTTSVGGSITSYNQGDVVRLLACSSTQLIVLSCMTFHFTTA